MSAVENVLKLIKEWQPRALSTELKYRDSFLDFLREKLPKAKIEKEYRHGGTTIDIYLKEEGFFASSEAFVELKRNLQQKPQLDRLVGQIESLEPRKHNIVVILCGDSDPALVKRLKDKYGTPDFGWSYGAAIIVKEPIKRAGKA